MSEINTLIKTSQNNKAVDYCSGNNLPSLGKLLSFIFNVNQDPTIKVRLLCNWTTSGELCKLWNKMSKGDGKWNKIQITSVYPADYYVIINSPGEDRLYDPSKTIIFHMEPHMKQDSYKWGTYWADPARDIFLKIMDHNTAFNNNEWHLSMTYNQLMNTKIEKTKGNILSTILSANYSEVGHKKRIDFIKFLDSKGDIQVDVFGNNAFSYNNYKGSLPYHQKDLGLLPYKYTFNAENNSIHNYYTEKLIDAILAECLCFYWGPPNIKELINPKAYVLLDLNNFEEDYLIVKKYTKDDNLWKERLPYIQAEKKRILNELQFFPRLESIIDAL